ncbi:MAG: ABC transporter substrate-binding protein, partial [Pseudomonadota bacterium]
MTSHPRHSGPARRRIGRLFAAALAAASALAVPQSFAADDAPVRVGKTFIAASLDPAKGSAGWALVSHGIAEQLFTVSREGTIEPNLAADAIPNEDGSWTVTLAKDRAFSDGTPVTADLVAEALNRSGAEGPAARASAGRITFTPDGEYTLEVTSERPTPILPSILAEWAFPVYRMDGDRFLFTGPFAVDAFVAGSHIDLVPNKEHPAAAGSLLPPVLVTRYYPSSLRAHWLPK